MTGHGLSNSTSSEGRDTGNTHCICYPQMFYTPSLTTGQHTLKDAKGVRPSSEEQAAATGTTHLSHSLRSPWEEGWLVSLCLSCAGGSSSFPTALQLGIALVWWAAGRKCGCHGTGPMDQGLCPTETLLMKRGTGSPVLQVDNSAAPSWQTMYFC